MRSTLNHVAAELLAPITWPHTMCGCVQSWGFEWHGEAPVQQTCHRIQTPSKNSLEVWMCVTTFFQSNDSTFLFRLHCRDESDDL